MLPADPHPGNGRALGVFAMVCAIVVPLWWFGMFVASMTPEAPRRIAVDLDGYFLPRYVYASARLAAGSLALWNADEFLTTALVGWYVGLQPAGPEQWEIWFGRLLLGHLEERTGVFHRIDAQVKTGSKEREEQ